MNPYRENEKVRLLQEILEILKRIERDQPKYPNITMDPITLNLGGPPRKT